MTPVPRLTPTADGGSVLELAIPAPPVPVKRSTRKRSTTPILPGVFPPGSWPKPGTPAHSKAVAEYQYLRAISGICRQCPNKLGRWKHRCDRCQEKERQRLRASGKANKPSSRLKHGFRKRRRSKFFKKAQQWLAFKTWERRKQQQQQENR